MDDIVIRNKKIIEDTFKKMSIQDETYLDFLSDDFTYHSAYETQKGKAALHKQYSGEIMKIPDFNLDIKRLIAEGNVVVAEYDWTETQRGEYLGLPATNKKFRIPFIGVFDIEDGKIKLWRDMFNYAYLEKQIT